MDQDDIHAHDPQVASQTPKSGIAKKFLSRAFNAIAKIGVGAAFGFAAKATVLAVTATATAPALAAAIAAGAAGGVASSLACHALHNRQLKKEGKETVKYDWKRKGLISALLGAAGGGIAIAAYFSDSISHAISNAMDYIKGPSVADIAPAAPAPVPVPAAPAKPVIGACLDDGIKTLVNADGASEKVHEAAARACSENAKASAQAMKDLGYHAYNGIGMEKSQKLGVEMLTKAAEAGNVQAIRDLAYIEYHGNEAAGVPKNVDAALERMRSVMHKDKLAMRLMKAWGAAVDTDTAAAAVHTPAPAAATPAADDLVHIDLPPSQPVVTVTVDDAAPAIETPAPETAPATPIEPPAPAAQEPGQTITSGGNSASYRAVFHAGGVDFHCPIDNNDFVIGDTVTIQRPPLLMPTASR